MPAGLAIDRFRTDLAQDEVDADPRICACIVVVAQLQYEWTPHVLLAEAADGSTVDIEGEGESARGLPEWSPVQAAEAL